MKVADLHHADIKLGLRVYLLIGLIGKVTGVKTDSNGFKYYQVIWSDGLCGDLSNDYHVYLTPIDAFGKL